MAAVYFGGAKLASNFVDVHIRGTTSVEQQVENLLAFSLYCVKFGSFERAMEKSPDARFLVTDKREQEAANSIEEYMNAHPETRSAKLFLIFGQNHESTFGASVGM